MPIDRPETTVSALAALSRFSASRTGMVLTPKASARPWIVTSCPGAMPPSRIKPDHLIVDAVLQRFAPQRLDLESALVGLGLHSASHASDAGRKQRRRYSVDHLARSLTCDL